MRFIVKHSLECFQLVPVAVEGVCAGREVLGKVGMAVPGADVVLALDRRIGSFVQSADSGGVLSGLLRMLDGHPLEVVAGEVGDHPCIVMALDDAKAVDGDRGEVGVELLRVTEQAERRSLRSNPTSNKPVKILVDIVRVFR